MTVESDKQNDLSTGTQGTVKKRFYRPVKIVLAVIAALVLIPSSCVLYMDWSAKRKAQAFCEEIKIGSEISIAVAKAKEKKIFLGTYQGYTFYFPGSGFNKAVCEVSVTEAGKVTAKNYEMEYD